MGRRGYANADSAALDARRRGQTRTVGPNAIKGRFATGAKARLEERQKDKASPGAPLLSAAGIKPGPRITALSQPRTYATPSWMFTRDELIDKALGSLIAVMQESTKTWPVKPPHTETLRFVLAFLYTGGDREPFETFYREAIIGSPEDVYATTFGRFQTMRSAYARIARLHGRDYW